MLVFFVAVAITGRTQTSPDIFQGRATLRSIGSLAENAPLLLGSEVRLRGVVTYLGNQTLPGHSIYVQDQTGAIALSPVISAPLALGDEVEVLGLYRREGEHAFIKGARIHWLWSGSDPVPLALRPEQAVEGGYAGRLVEIQGRLMQKALSQRAIIFALEGEHQFFTANLDLSTPGFKHIAASYHPGMILELTGICAMPYGTDTPSPVGFTILLRSPDDIRVLRPAPWFNFQHILWLIPAIFGFFFILYRIRIHNLNLRYRAVTEERARIAREMHDTLAQGFTSVAWQLEGLVVELQPLKPTAGIRHHLDLALRMVRRSLEEAQDSIFVLRSLSTQETDLLKMLVKSAEFKMTARFIEIRSMSRGGKVLLPDVVKHHLLRIGQEAITNALRHSNATRIDLKLYSAPEHIELLVIDNGIGFSLKEAKSTTAGHFGIAGMHERATAINALIEINASPGKGTMIRIVIPCKHLPPRSLERIRQWFAKI